MMAPWKKRQGQKSDHINIYVVQNQENTNVNFPFTNQRVTSGKTQSQQKCVRFGDAENTERRQVANYNLRPRKRKVLSEHREQSRKVFLTDNGQVSSRTTLQDGESDDSVFRECCKRSPTPFPIPIQRKSAPEVAGVCEGNTTERVKRKISRPGQRRRRRQVLSSSMKETLRAVRTAAFHSKYKELYMIGQGGFGDVFAGFRTNDHLPVAIKHISRRNVYSKVTDQRGNRIPTEVALMLHLSGESTGSAAHVQLLDWYDLYSQVILVLERPVPCTNLFRYCRSKSSLEEDKAKAIMKQLIEEVKLFDSKGVFHRDLKLENILINTNSREPRIWVIDFGVGCFFTKRSVYRIFQGTPQHVPPEYNFRGRYRAGPTTVWQLGVVLYELLHDEDFSTVPFLLNQLLINKDLSEECLDLLGRCLETFPKQRMTLEEIQFHPWFSGNTNIVSSFSIVQL